MNHHQSIAGFLGRVPIAVFVGFALLSTSVVGVNLALNTPSSPANAPAQPESGLRKAVAVAHVDLEHGVTPLYPGQPGEVVHVEVSEGQEVPADAPLIYLKDDLALAQVQQAEAALEEARVQLAIAKDLFPQRDAKREAQEQVIKAKQYELEAARAGLSRARRLERLRAQSAEQTRAAEMQVKALEEVVKGERAKLRVLSSLNPAGQQKRAEQDVLAKEALLDQALEALRHCTLWAPGRGTILRINASVGRFLGKPQPGVPPAILFAPAGPRIVRAEVEQEFAGLVYQGQRTQMQDDSTGTGNWTGRVRRISDWYTHRRSILLEPLQRNDVRTIECIIDVDPGQPPLRIGQRMRVTLER